jgi:hypothetical protein
MESWAVERQVRVAVFEGEPLARLAAQRLQEAGVPCVVHSIGVGPGGWGMAANLPYAVSVLPADQRRAREVLELPPAEIPEREGVPQRRPTRMALVLLLIAAAVLLSVADRLFEAILR